MGGTFELSHVGTRRVSTAAAFYGADFGLETPLYLGEETAPHALFEVLSNNTTLIHNDPGNIFRAYDVYRGMRNYERAEKVLCDQAVFYPLEGEQLGKISFYGKFRHQCAELRRYCDFEVTDSRMLQDGYRKDLIFTPGAPLTEETAELIRKIGLNAVYCEDAPPVVIETGEPFRYGSPVRDFSVLGRWDGRYVTKRENGSVVFDANRGTISYE